MRFPHPLPLLRQFHPISEVMFDTCEGGSCPQSLREADLSPCLPGRDGMLRTPGRWSTFILQCRDCCLSWR